MNLDNYYNQKSVYRKISRGRLLGILALAGSLEGKKVLDIGCGAGELGIELKKLGATTVHGLDVAESAVLEARKNLDDAAVFNLESGDWPGLVLDGGYDLVVMSEVLEHLFDPVAALVRVRQKFDCPVIITVPNVVFWKNRLKIFWGQFDYTDTGLMDRGHIHFFTWHSLVSTVKQAGYNIIDQAHRVPTTGTKILAKVFPGLFVHNFIIKITH